MPASPEIADVSITNTVSALGAWQPGWLAGWPHAACWARHSATPTHHTKNQTKPHPAAPLQARHAAQSELVLVAGFG